MSLNGIKNINSDPAVKKILLVHFFLCGLALIKLITLFVTNIYDVTLLNFAVGKIGNKALFSGAGKLAIILQYFVGLFFLAIYVILVNIIIQHSKIRKNSFFTRTLILAAYFLLNAYFTCRLLVAGNDFLHWLPAELLFMFLLPIFLITLPVKLIPVIPKWLSVAMIMGVLLQIWLIFQPMITQPMLIENDYMDIPGQTQLNTGKWVDNTQFINQHNIGGIFKYDPRIDHGKAPAPLAGTFVVIHPTSLFNQFLQMNQNNPQYRLVYYPQQNRLAVKGVIPDQDHMLLSYAFTDAKDKQEIDKLYLLSIQQKHFYEQRVYTPVEWDFIQKNQTELVDQGKTGWFFYHHNYFFAPIFAATHGADLSQVTMVYGWLNTLLIGKVLTWIGGVNYQNYFHLLFSLYPIYYLGFVLLVFFIFRRWEYSLLALLIAVVGLFGIGIELIRLWPGLNPVRHLLDLPVFLCFYCYAKERKLPWLLLSYLLSFIGLLCSKEFGLFLIASLSATVIIRAMYERNALLPAIFAILSSVIGLLAFIAIPGKNPGYSYLLLGIGSPVTRSSMVVIALIFGGVLYYAAILFRKMDNPINYFWLSVLFYCQLLLVYALWFPMAHHLLNIAVPLALLALCLIYLLPRYLKSSERTIVNLALILMLIIYVPTAAAFYLHANKYYRNFATHKLYEWPFATAHFKSTMDPQLFLHAVSLIKQYEHANAIYIISRYDDLLPVLADKYSAMPYNELLTNLITTNDLQLIADYIAAKKPHYLFIDTDIARNFNNEIYMPDDPLSKQLKLTMFTADRASTLSFFQQVYARIKKNYRPVANTELITVYERMS